MATTRQIFNYNGTDRLGRKTSGEITSPNANLARAMLRKRGIQPTRVSKKGLGFRLGFPGAKVNQRDIALFTRQLATMVKAGVPLVQSFEIVADGMDKPAMKDLILKIKDRVSAGDSFTHAIKAQPGHFDDLFCNLVRVGEQSGTLETMLDRLAMYKEKTEAFKARTKNAMTYPLAVLVVAGAVSGVLLVKVVPQIEAFFAGFGAELPALTQVVVAMSRFMQTWWLALVAAMVAIFFACRAAHKRSPALRDRLDKLALKTPILGNLLDKSCIARFARTLSTTFAAGVPLVDALDSVADATGNALYLEAITKVREEVSGGIQLNVAMKRAGVFPGMVLQMVAIGEEAGALDTMLDKVAVYYEEMADNAVERLASLMEPLIMSFLGLVIGGLVIAMYLPLFTMGDAIGAGGY